MAKIVDKEAKRKKILLAALRVIAEKGLTGTRMSDIARAADVGKGTLYEYFRSKEEILHAGFLLIFEQGEEVLAQKLSKITDPPEKIHAILTGFVEALDSFPVDFMQIMFDVWAEGVRSVKAKETTIFDMRKLYAEYRGLLASILVEGMRKGIFRNDLQPDIIASGILGSWDGLMLQWVLDHSVFDFKKAVEAMYTAYMKGILTQDFRSS
jgi:AcrR family transcriptional regulator